jgi:hypothetical protein
MNEDGRKLIEQIHREAVTNHSSAPVAPSERPTIPYTELPEMDSASPLFQEWNSYRHEVQRLLAEGHEGKFVLIKGDAIIGFYETWDAARAAGLNRYLLKPFLVHQIQSREPVLRLRGYNLPCRS